MDLSIPRSPHTKTGGIVYFARMLDKIRLHANGQLPQDYTPNLGEGFDLRCVHFLGVSYEAIAAIAKAGASDDEALGWCFAHGHHPSEEEIEVWNEFMRKRGWNDVASERLQQRLAEGGHQSRADIQTFFDYIDLDEGRL
jgi:gluconokinase